MADNAWEVREREWEARMAVDEEWLRVPSHTRAMLICYLARTPGACLVSKGSFKHALLTNNLTHTFMHADAQNLLAMRYIVGVMYRTFPSIAWGSEEKIQKWLTQND